jgi:hypothetical protein
MVNLLLAVPKGIAGLFLKIIVSPGTVWIISLILTGDFRLSSLYSLIFYSVFSLATLVYNLFDNASLSKLIAFLFSTISGIFFIISLIIYWGIYITIWGTNLNLN